MKKGFTLMELLGSVVIMSIVLTIATISVVAIINSAKQKAYNTQVQLIVSKAKDWALDNETKLTPDGGINFIDLSTLVSSGYVDNPTISDPRNGSTMSGCIVIIYNSDTSQYEYRYSDSVCSLEQSKYGPTWTYSNVSTVEVGTTFQFPNMKAVSTSTDKKSLDIKGPQIDIVDDKHNIIVAKVDTVDTSYVGRIYGITYTAYDPTYKYTFSTEYFVKVVDTNNPVITMGDTKGTEKKNASTGYVYVLQGSNQTAYSVMNMVVTDNSCSGMTYAAQANNNCSTTLIAHPDKTTISLANTGQIDVKYSATDLSNNTGYYTVHYYVAERSYAFNNKGEYDVTIHYPGTYTIEGNGAKGSNGTKAGGNGGYISGTVTLNFGDAIHISVGGVGGGAVGATNTTGYANGGKSTIISKSGTSLLIAAGGGAGGSLTAGGNGGSGSGAGGAWPKVCDGITDNPNPYPSDVCPTKSSEALPNPPTACTSAARGSYGTNGSGGGSSGSLTFPAHTCEKVQDTCKQWNNCQNSSCGHTSCPNEAACGCAVRNSCPDSSCGTYCAGYWYYNTCYACYNNVCDSGHYYCDPAGYLVGSECAASETAVGNNTSWGATWQCDSWSKQWYACQSSACGSSCSDLEYNSCQNSNCSCNMASSCVNDSCPYASCETSGCGCSVWNYKDGGSNYTGTSYGYGGQGGTSSLNVSVSQVTKTNGNSSGDGNAKITIVQ